MDEFGADTPKVSNIVRRLATLGTDFGERGILTVCLLYPGSAQACSQPLLESQLWGGGGIAVADSVAGVVSASSYGQVVLSAARSRFITVDMSGALASQYTVAQMSCTTGSVDHVTIANSRLPANLSLSAYDHVEYILPPEVKDCSDICGLGSIGQGTTWIRCIGAGGEGVYVRAHEFGHNLGLQHTGIWPALDKASAEYGDGTCTMGGGWPAHLEEC